VAAEAVGVVEELEAVGALDLLGEIVQADLLHILVVHVCLRLHILGAQVLGVLEQLLSVSLTYYRALMKET
jgi:hypothetical protein